MTPSLVSVPLELWDTVINQLSPTLTASYHSSVLLPSLIWPSSTCSPAVFCPPHPLLQKLTLEIHLGWLYSLGTAWIQLSGDICKRSEGRRQVDFSLIHPEANTAFVLSFQAAVGSIPCLSPGSKAVASNVFTVLGSPRQQPLLTLVIHFLPGHKVPVSSIY